MDELSVNTISISYYIYVFLKIDMINKKINNILCTCFPKFYAACRILC